MVVMEVVVCMRVSFNSIMCISFKSIMIRAEAPTHACTHTDAHSGTLCQPVLDALYVLVCQSAHWVHMYLWNTYHPSAVSTSLLAKEWHRSRNHVALDVHLPSLYMFVSAMLTSLLM